MKIIDTDSCDQMSRLMKNNNTVLVYYDHERNSIFFVRPITHESGVELVTKLKKLLDTYEITDSSSEQGSH